MHRKCRPRATSRAGLTLLELVLALSLSVLVLMSIGMAIDMHYRMLDVRRTNVEESQMARAALRHIADDLKAAVVSIPPDLSGLDAMSSNMSGALGSLAANAAGLSGALGGSGLGNSGLSGSGQSSGGLAGSGAGSTQQPTGEQSGQESSGSGAGSAGSGQGTGGSGSGQTAGGSGSGSGAAGASVSGAADTEDPAAETPPASSVKLYGTATELRFDISRLPRVDQYQTLMSSDSLVATDIPSDVKTVIYFIRSDDTQFGLPDPSPTGIGRGLMRTEIDNAVSAWAEAGGDTTLQYAGAKLLAEEVTSLAFQYWDGAEWLPEWNSDDLGGLPLAVEVVITIQPTRAMTEDEIARVAAADSTTLPEEQTYKLVVQLPTAVSTATRTLEADAAEIAAVEILPSEPSGTETAGSSSGSGQSGSTGGGGSFGVGGIGGGIVPGGDRPPPDGPMPDGPMPVRPMPVRPMPVRPMPVRPMPG